MIEKYTGYTSYRSSYLEVCKIACIPALRINIASEQWFMEGSENEGNERNEKIALQTTSIQGKIKAKKRGFLIKWKKQSAVTGYQIQYSTNKNFKKKNTKNKFIKNWNKGKLTVKKLKPKKKYYVRIRTYRITNGMKNYSAWSKVKSVKTKR